MGGHYRDPLNFTWESLTASQNALNKLKKQVSAVKSEKDRTALSNEKNEKIKKYRNGFMEAVNDDLNTSKALAVLWEVLKSNIPSSDKYDLAMSFDEVLGLDLGAVSKEKEMPEEAKELMAKREELRREKKFEEADKLRKQIEDMGFSVTDTSL